MTSAERADDSARPAAVYVIDDDPELRESLSWLLDSVGIKATGYPLADEFLTDYRGDHPACLILDVRMPRMSGPKLQDELMAKAPHVSIIFVSAHGDIRMSVKTMRSGAVDFLEKPYDPQQLLDTVQVGIEKAEAAFAEYTHRQIIQERIDHLTPREREILLLVVEGMPSQNIARRLGMSVKTVDVHRARIRAKADAESINVLVRDILRYRIEIGG
ncbi:MAG: response regulator transcription factor [Actinomycetales bacterium]